MIENKQRVERCLFTVALHGKQIEQIELKLKISLEMRASINENEISIQELSANLIDEV